MKKNFPKALILIAGALVVAGVGVVIGRATVSTPTTSTSTSTTSSTSTTTGSTSTSTTSPLTQPDTAVYPFASTSMRFATPTGAARAFATDFLRFTDPVVGEFQAGDSQSGEVNVSNRDGGAVTTVLLRKFGSPSTWWVLGSSTPNIIVTSPAPLSSVSSPMSLTGSSTAFEAVVNVSLYRDGSLVPVQSGTVMGGSMGMMGSFTSNFSYGPLHGGHGTLVFCTLSAKDGSVVEASTVRVTFAP
jgi:hypothetical protein